MKPVLLSILSLTAGFGLAVANGLPASAQILGTQAGGMYNVGPVGANILHPQGMMPTQPMSIRAYPRQYAPVQNYSPPAAPFRYNSGYPTSNGILPTFNPLKPYGPGNGAGPGYFVPPSISTYPGYDYSDYCASGSGFGVYPTVYGDYNGMPNYFYEPGSVVFNAGSTVYCDGTFYPYGYDPFSTGTLGQITDLPDTSGAPFGADIPPTGQLPLASDLLKSLDLIASAWKSGNSSALTQMVPSNTHVAVAIDGKYQYSIAPTTYVAMTKDAMHHLSTTDFRFTGVSVGASGVATGYAIQSYKDSNGQPAKVYLAYALRKSPAAPHGYVLSGFGSSPRPVLISKK